MTISQPNRIPLAGVIGAPIAHSRSPRLHGHWLAQAGLRGHYVPLHVEAEDLADVLKVLPKAGFVGVNVTIPHKQAALVLATTATDRARRIGAANTLTFLPNGGFHADNTDAHGFIENLRQGVDRWSPTTDTALVFGAGGAARAVIVALQAAGVERIMLANRSAQKAHELADEMGAPVQAIDWEVRHAAVANATLIINSTSLGMSGQPDLDLSLDAMRPGTVVNDLVYAPLETTLLRTARAAGATCVDGLGMLLYQGVPGFQKWFGASPVVDAATRAAVLA